MKSVEIYKVLNSYLKDDFKLLSYKKFKLERLGWYKQIGDNYLIIFFRCNYHGWDIHTGTDFEIQIGCYDKISEISWPLKHASLKEILEERALREFVILQNSVIRKFQPYDVDRYKADHPTADPAFVDFLRKQCEPINFPPTEIDMMNMHCYDMDDVHRWGDFFQKRVVMISGVLENRWK